MPGMGELDLQRFSKNPRGRTSAHYIGYRKRRRAVGRHIVYDGFVLGQHGPDYGRAAISGGSRVPVSDPCKISGR